MSNLSRRMKKVEKKLNLDRERIVVRITSYEDKEGFDLSNPAEEWLTYPEAVKKALEMGNFIVLHEGAEIEARRAASLLKTGSTKK